MGWEVIKTPVENMFRLEELYNEKKDYIYRTEEELEVIEKLTKDLLIDDSGNI